MENGLLQDLDKNIPVGVSICDTKGNFLRVHDFFKEIFNNDNLKSVNDEKKLKDLFNSTDDYISFYIKQRINCRYYRLYKNLIDDYVIFILSDITFLTSNTQNIKFLNTL